MNVTYRQSLTQNDNYARLIMLDIIKIGCEKEIVVISFIKIMFKKLVFE